MYYKTHRSGVTKIEKTLWLLVVVLTAVYMSSCSKLDMTPSYKIIAHRGYYQAASGAENSLQAIEAAYKAGIDGVEIDVRATKDDSLVLVHDDTYAGKLIANSTYNDLAKTRLPNGEKLPTLTMCFNRFKSYNNRFILFLDIKSERATVLSARLYKAMGMGNNVFLPLSIVEYMQEREGLSLTGNYQDAISAEKGKVKIASIDISENDLSGKSTRLHEVGIESNIYVIETESDLIKATKYNPTYITTNIPLEALQFRYNYE